MNAIDPKTIAWTPMPASPRMWTPDFSSERAFHLADAWLGDFGITLMPDGQTIPDAWSDLGDGKFAFRIDSMGKSVIVFVHIDYDGAPDGHDTCQRVEIVRG